MQPQPYAPYPLNVARDWLERRRNWVRLVVAVVAGAWLGPAAYRLWNLPNPPVRLDYSPAGLADAGLNIPPPEVDRSKELMAAINSLPRRPSAGPTATPVPPGMTWLTWSEYERAQGIPPGQDSQPGSAPDVVFAFDPCEALSGPLLETRFHLRQIVDYLELPATRAALQTISQLSCQPFCLYNRAVNPAGILGLGAVRELAKLLTARAHYQLIRRHDYAAAADDLETVWRLSAGVEDDGMLIPLFVGMACRGLAFSEVINWCREGLLTRAEADDLLGRMGRHSFDGQAAVRVAFDGEYRSSLSYLDGLYPPGEHSRQVFCLAANRPGNWLVRSLNLLSPLTYDRGEARRWVQACWDLDRPENATSTVGPLQVHGGLRAHVTQDPLFALAGFYQSSLVRTPTLARRIEAEEEAARTSLALVMFKADRGRYPTRLEALVPAYLPTLRPDPFSGKPLCYRVEPDGRFTLYSVGEDGQDDGGGVAPTLSGRPRDQVFTSRGGPHEEWVLVPTKAISRPSEQP